MKAIKIGLRGKLDAALSNVNGSAEKHTFGAWMLEPIARNAEDRLEKLRVPKALRRGCRMWAISGGDLPSSYKYNPVRTEVLLERRPAGWYLIDAQRTERYGSRVPQYRLALTAAASVAGWERHLREMATDVLQDDAHSDA